MGTVGTVNGKRCFPLLWSILILVTGTRLVAADIPAISRISQIPQVPQIKKVREALTQIKPFKVLFVQEVFTDEAEQPDIRESGEIIFKSDRALKWTYLAPDYKVFLLEGDDYRFYDEDNEQLIIGKIQDKSRQWIWQVLFSDDLARSSQINWDDTDKTLHIRHDPDANPAEKGEWGDAAIDIEVTVNGDFLPVKVLQKDPAGARILYYFNEYTPHAEINDETFRLTVPDDVEIIREES